MKWLLENLEKENGEEGTELTMVHTKNGEVEAHVVGEEKLAGTNTSGVTL